MGTVFMHMLKEVRESMERAVSMGFFTEIEEYPFSELLICLGKYLVMKFAAIIAAVAANRYETMNEDDLLVSLESTLSSAQASEARGDSDAAVAKTAAIKNIQKALTARILKRLDDGQPLVEVARKMKAIEGMQPQINDMERRLGIMQSVEPVLENAIKTLQKVVDVRGMGKK